MTFSDTPGIIHLFPNGNVEVGTGKPGYRWVQGYSQVVRKGRASQPLTRKHWQLIAQRDGEKLKFHKSHAEAEHAAEGVA